MATTQRVDPDTLTSLATAYQRLEGESTKIGSYLKSNCELDSAIGLLLLWLKPLFDQARDNGFAAFAAAGKALTAAGDQVDAALKYAEQTESQVQQQLKAMQAQIDKLNQEVSALESQQGSGGGGGGGGSSSGGGGGGSFSPVSPGGGATLPTTAPATAPVTAPVIPPAATTAPPAPQPPVTITVNVDDRDTNVTVGDGNSGAISVNGAAGAASPTTTSTATIDPTTLATLLGGQPGSATVTPGGTPIDGSTLDASTQAHDAQLYDKLWDEVAKDDPLGRSADQLRQLWESREAIEIPGDTGAGILGQGATSAPLPDLQLIVDIPRGGGTPTVSLGGASR